MPDFFLEEETCKEETGRKCKENRGAERRKENHGAERLDKSRF
jgi:hypothetical protein